jgi:hypothetical protein
MPPSSRIRWTVTRNPIGRVVWTAYRERGRFVTRLGSVREVPDGWESRRVFDGRVILCTSLRSAALWIVEAGR